MRSDARHPPVQRLSVQDCIPTVRILALLILAKCASYVERPQNQSVATAMELVVKNTISSWNKSPYGKYYCCGNLRCCFAGDQEAALPTMFLEEPITNLTDPSAKSRLISSFPINCCSLDLESGVGQCFQNPKPLKVTVGAGSCKEAVSLTRDGSRASLFRLVTCSFFAGM